MFKKQVYVNEKKNKTNPILIGIVCLIIGVSWTSNFYMFQDLQKDYDRTITIYNTAVSHRIDRERSSVMVQDEAEASVTDNGADTHASLNGAEGVNSPSTVEEMSAYTSRVAIVTAYSEYDSCHYENCVMASGKRAYVGAVACPREIALGTKVIINDKTYTCEDRTNLNLNGRFDIFMGYGDKAYQSAIEYGIQKKEVQIIS